MSSPQVSIAAVALLSAHLLHAVPIMEERQSSIQWYSGGDFYSRFNYQAPQSDGAYPPGTQCGYQTATDDASWVLSTANSNDNPAQYVWTQDDATTANCLINLHFTQGDSCISVQGSECESGAGSSKILIAVGFFPTSSGDAGSQLSSDDSDALQAASSALVGATVNSAPGAGVQIIRIDPSDKTADIQQGDVPAEHGGVQISFGGDNQC